MMKTRAQLALGGTQLIGGRYEPLAVVARMPLAVHMTAMDLSGSTPEQRVMLALPDERLTAPQVAALRERFRRLAHLAHPNIPSYRPGSTHGACWCVSDCIDGEPLADIVEQLAPASLEKQEIEAIMEKLGSALAAAHEQGISHGAISLENVIVTPDLDIRLTGFDLGDGAGRLDFAPEADIAALELLADELQGPYGLNEAPSAPEVPLHASRLLPEEYVPRRRRRGALRIAAVAVVVFAVIALNPADLWRFVRTAADPDAATATAPGELPREAQELALVPDAGVPDAGVPDPVLPVPVLPDAELRDAGLPEAGNEPPAIPAEAFRGEAADGPAPVLDRNDQPAPRDPATVGAAGARSDPDELPRSDRGEATRAERSPEPTPADEVLRFSPAGLVTVRESDGTARLSLRPEARRSMEVIWWIADGSARRDSDYADPGLTSAGITAGSAVDIVVSLVADAIAESDEVFEVYASAVENGKQVGVPARATVRIVDDD